MLLMLKLIGFSKARRLYPVLVMVAFMSLPLQAAAQDTGAVAISDRLERLERDIRTLNQQLSRMPGQPSAPGLGAASPSAGGSAGAATGNEVGVPSGSALDRLLDRLNALETEVRQVNGAMEGVDHRIFLMETHLERLTGDLEFRLSRLEGNPLPQAMPTARAAPGPASVSTLSSSSSPIVSATPGAAQTQPGVLGTIGKGRLDARLAESGDVIDGGEAASAAMPQPMAAAMPIPRVLPVGEPKAQYQYAFNLLRRAKYADAEAAWKEFIELNAPDPLTDNARYWLGETYYVQKQFLESAQAFLESYRAAPKGAKAPDSLFKLGKSMSAMDKNDEACAAFGKLRKEFDAIPASLGNLLDREVKTLKCK